MELCKRLAGPLLLTVCATLIFVQIMLRPAVGLANNGDFPKMAGSLGLGPDDGGWAAHRWSGLVYRYVHDPKFFYKRDFRHAEYLSSEFFLIKLARGLQRTFRPGPERICLCRPCGAGISYDAFPTAHALGSTVSPLRG